MAAIKVICNNCKRVFKTVRGWDNTTIQHKGTTMLKYQTNIDFTYRPTAEEKCPLCES